MKDTQINRKDRLASALRENLKRRKARERALAIDKTLPSEATSKGHGGSGPNAAKKGL